MSTIATYKKARKYYPALMAWKYAHDYELAKDLDLEVSWEVDNDYYQFEDDKRIKKLMDSGDLQPHFACVVDSVGNVLECLGGILLGFNDEIESYEFELLSNALNTLKKGF